MLKNIGTPELIIVGLVIVLLFGSKKIPEFMKGIGEAIKEFRNASKDEQ
ncbi:preprotein translocase subunit TatA [Candidatus Woesebacteria bacterium RIFOXYA1_FULL_40_18]|uniref:Sec-independent protein translocase protein TatA n=4 Tax=Candidatus Woeseibacteriota TaxID=1752722 RepID=A0A0G0SL37_9BACT|nr:MAG: Sec-independent protein translocase protein TatA [Candidatus Woesebacteria bacterium GW2011_GWA1_40_45]OGM76185.1 MAG: preprotein translocase subunit TatA [Candidatus Woesebacteria bacterium RIFOXYA1_FULL_40_18]OGM80577.1 MAG: preprotein translocase subunit TatA [Candidatus Woesebacteria bacterium RIFOXYB1_FULL_40_26]OGM88315.1 MAG: preprotein translocase subunit TatA [Candidatus Woesebacteria bacterium RIFOXYD1_FULL_40_21]